MRIPRSAALLACFLVTACGSGGEPVRYTAEPAPAVSHVGIRYSSVSVRDISLPTYAAEETISVETASGQLTESPDNIWADDPVRAVTLRFAQALTAISRARVAPDPWPFASEPEAVVDIRMESFVATAAGRFVATGQYFVAPEDPAIAERAGSFSLSVPYDAAGGYPAIAAARSVIVTDLALLIARRGLR